MTIEKRTNALVLGDDLDERRPVLIMAADVIDRHLSAPHSHRRAQLVYASQGILSVTTRQGSWVVLPQHAVWVPPQTEHQTRSGGPLSMRYLYIHPEAVTRMPERCCVLPVPDLLRCLILEACHEGNDYSMDLAQQRLLAVLIDRLHRLQPSPLHLPWPRDPRLRLMSDKLLHSPADRRLLSDWSELVGASARTLARLFRKDTGMTFGQWRQRLRLFNAINLLGSGQSVTRVALDLGYQSPSAFIAMFRKNFGAPPTRYFRPN